MHSHFSAAVEEFQMGGRLELKKKKSAWNWEGNFITYTSFLGGGLQNLRSFIRHS